jgi:hypothetical protein
VVMPTSSAQNAHSARSLLRQGSVPIPDGVHPSEVKIETSEDAPETVSVVLTLGAGTTNGEEEGSSENGTSPARAESRSRTARSSFSWDTSY